MSEPAQGSLFPESPMPRRKAAAEASGRKGAPAVPRAKRAPAGPKRARKAGGRQEFSAGFLLFRETPGGILYLLLDYGKHWDYAKGHLEEGETAWQAAVRELREETGIRQVDRVGDFERTMHYVFFSPKKGNVHKTVTYFLGRTRWEEVTLSHEHSGHAWLPFADALERLTYENARELLRAGQEYLDRHANGGTGEK